MNHICEFPSCSSPSTIDIRGINLCNKHRAAFEYGVFKKHVGTNDENHSTNSIVANNPKWFNGCIFLILIFSIGFTPS